jgi:peptidyl-tRNA hydrolase
MRVVMYCIFAKESVQKMNGNRGKLAAQAGHAYLHAYWDAEDKWQPFEPDAAGHLYRTSERAYKICLIVDTVQELEQLHEAYKALCGVSLVKDAGITVFNEPTITCLGLGPISEENIGEDIKKLKVFI